MAKRIKQLPETKRTYRGKNPAGGRKAFFRQSMAYKRKPASAFVNAAGIAKIATEWGS